MSNYVVIDLEMCRVPKKRRIDPEFFTETIEIGATLLDDSLQIVDEFKTFVSPEYGKIDRFIENLTKITNDDVSSAPDFERAIEMLFDWLPDDTVMISWSPSDAYQLSHEAMIKNVYTKRLRSFTENAIDCQLIFSEKINSVKSYSLTDALIIACIEYTDGAHDALVDAHNTALLYRKIMKSPEFITGPNYSFGNNASTYCPFAELLSSFSAAV